MGQDDSTRDDFTRSLLGEFVPVTKPITREGIEAVADLTLPVLLLERNARDVAWGKPLAEEILNLHMVSGKPIRECAESLIPARYTRPIRWEDVKATGIPLFGEEAVPDE